MALRAIRKAQLEGNISLNLNVDFFQEGLTISPVWFANIFIDKVQERASHVHVFRVNIEDGSEVVNSTEK